MAHLTVCVTFATRSPSNPGRFQTQAPGSMMWSFLARLAFQMVSSLDADAG